MPCRTSAVRLLYAPASVPARARIEAPLVGRDAELARLMAAFRAHRHWPRLLAAFEHTITDRGVPAGERGRLAEARHDRLAEEPAGPSDVAARRRNLRSWRRVAVAAVAEGESNAARL
jgi:hypothetical protein